MSFAARKKIKLPSRCRNYIHCRFSQIFGWHLAYSWLCRWWKWSRAEWDVTCMCSQSNWTQNSISWQCICTARNWARVPFTGCPSSSSPNSTISSRAFTDQATTRMASKSTNLSTDRHSNDSPALVITHQMAKPEFMKSNSFKLGDC